jgi:cell wall-associated NlpC family hydrolase
MSAVGVDDAWAVLALPPGVRDLGCAEYWERSLARSRRRREAAARSTVSTRRVIPAAMTAAMLVGGAGSVAHAQQPATTATSGISGLLKRGSRGPAVADAQRALGITADGIFGPQTRRAVRAFQSAHGLAVDGVIGPITSAALYRGGAAGATSEPRVHLPAATTMALQRALGISVDGAYGPQTRRAVRAYQAAHGLAVDGVAGPQTLGALGISTAAAPQGSPSSPGSGALAAVSAARSQIGTPYATAGAAPGGFDCSGLTMWAFGRAGITLPRTSYAQYGVGTPVSRTAIQAGDLVFFDTSGGGASHVGIATSASTVISATTHGVMEHSIADSYWSAHYVGARRV